VFGVAVKFIQNSCMGYKMEIYVNVAPPKRHIMFVIISKISCFAEKFLRATISGIKSNLFSAVVGDY
jgi:hypothetical protein